MSSIPKRILRIADRLKEQASLKKRRPPGTNLLDEDISVDPHSLTGLTTNTMGGPGRKTRQPHIIDGPRGIACSEQEVQMKNSTAKRLAKVAETLRSMRKIAQNADLKDLTDKVTKLNAAIQSGRLPPPKMQQAAAMLAQLTMQMAQAVANAQQQQAAQAHQSA